MMQSIAKGLLCCLQQRILAAPCVLREYGSSRKAEQVIVLESLGYLLVQFPKVAAVAFVKHEDDVLVINFVGLVLGNETAKFLNRGDDNAVVFEGALCGLILQLVLKNFRGLIAVCRPLLEAVIFLHRLVVKVLAVNHE